MEIIDKLQIKPGEKVAVIAAPQEVAGVFKGVAELDPTSIDPSKLNTLILFARNSVSLTENIGRYGSQGSSALKLWVAYPKGKTLGTDINRDVLHEKLKESHWDAVRLISLDDTWSVMRFKWIGA